MPAAMACSPKCLTMNPNCQLYGVALPSRERRLAIVVAAQSQ
jgi:hypothetical protein